MPRRKSKHLVDRYTAIAAICFTDDEKAQVVEKACRAGLSLSNYARRVLLRQPLPQGDVTASRQLIKEINATGVNLNQLARIANTTGRLPSGLTKCLAQVEVLLDKLLPK